MGLTGDSRYPVGITGCVKTTFICQIQSTCSACVRAAPFQVLVFSMGGSSMDPTGCWVDTAPLPSTAQQFPIGGTSGVEYLCLCAIGFLMYEQESTLVSMFTLGKIQWLVWIPVSAGFTNFHHRRPADPLRQQQRCKKITTK